jgi:hypothetical protein
LYNLQPFETNERAPSYHFNLPGLDPLPGFRQDNTAHLKEIGDGLVFTDKVSTDNTNADVIRRTYSSQIK